MFTEQEIENLKKIATLDIDEIWGLIRVSLDECMRISIQDRFQGDGKPMNEDNKHLYKEASEAYRKMYRAHADGVEYPFTQRELLDIPKEKLKAYLDTLPDPAPNSYKFRTEGT